MYPYDIIFPLNDKESIVIELQMSFEVLPCYCAEGIFFIHEKQKYCLAYFGLEDNLKQFQHVLIDALANKLQPHESITNDIGYLENIEKKYDLRNPNTYDDTWKGTPSLAYDKKESYFVWVGYRYQVWGYENLATWIYNNREGAIVLKITQRYPYLFVKNKKDIKISFLKWMKSYKPLFIRVISFEIAQKWLKQVSYMVDYIDKRISGLQKDALVDENFDL